MTKSTLKGFAGMKARDPEGHKAASVKGGKSTPADKRTFSQNRDYAAEAGRKGGAISRGGGRKKKVVPSAD